MHCEAFKAPTSLISLHAQRQESISSLSAFDLTSIEFDFVLDADLTTTNSQQLFHHNHLHNINKPTQFSSHDIDSMINNEFESIKSNLLNANHQQQQHVINESGDLVLDLSDLDWITNHLEESPSDQGSAELDLNMLDFLLQDPPSIASSSTYDQLSSPSAEISLNSLKHHETYDSESIESPATSYMNSEDSQMLSGAGDEDESILSASDLTRKSKTSKRLGRVKTSDSCVNKRESNKAAANRYRLKKLKERDELFNECETYELKNIELKRKIDDVQTEINCIKNLLVEALLTKKNSQ